MDSAKNLQFNIRKQVESSWCWAAVGTSCALAYKPDSGWTQCKLASACIGEFCCGEDKPTTCKDLFPGDANYTDCKTSGLNHGDKIGYLITDDKKGAFDITKIAGAKYDEKEFSYQDLVKQINEGNLIAVFVQNPNYAQPGVTITNHFVVVSGYSIIDGIEKVTVHDPYHASTSNMEFNKFKTAYKGGRVVREYFLTKSDSPLTPDTSFFSSNEFLESFPDRAAIFKNAKIFKELSYSVYTANWEDILKDGHLKSATQLEQRFFQKGDNDQLGALKFEEGKGNISDEVNFGRMVNEHSELFNKFKSLDKIKGLKHSLLELELLKITAIWFQSNNSNKDVFIPLNPSFYGLKAGEVYNFEEFMPKVVYAAQKFKEAIS